MKSAYQPIPESTQTIVDQFSKAIMDLSKANKLAVSNITESLIALYWMGHVDGHMDRIKEELKKYE